MLATENTEQEEEGQQQQQQGAVQQTEQLHNENNISTAPDQADQDATINTMLPTHNMRNIETNIDATSPHYNNSNIQQQQQSSMSSLSISLMQSSPPPHSYRHSRAYRHFKNPPQPHMCIRTTTAETGEELFINVLSWTRIVIPQEPSDPIPLYGGMRVPPGSPRSPPIVFAVMANPEVLKDSGRHSKDAEERRAMVELMCDFVEAMNPGVKLVRNAVILKDRDISGELKDVWNAVQAQRDREREEQMLAQRQQQQQYHNITNQQMFPKSSDASTTRTVAAATATNNSVSSMTAIEKQFSDQELLSNGVEFSMEAFAQQLDNKVASENVERVMLNNDTLHIESAATELITISNNDSTGNECVDQTDTGCMAIDNQNANAQQLLRPTILSISQYNTSQTEATNTINVMSNAKGTKSSAVPTTTTTTTTNIANANVTASPAPVTVVPPKKEKLGGFLPNGCIFPRFKNNKNKDKDNQKETKSKEKTLLNALKKSKDKKVTPIQQNANVDKMTTVDSTQYEKNCINNLESEVQKLDLNKIETTANNEMLIKLKIASNATSAATTTTTATAK